MSDIPDSPRKLDPLPEAEQRKLAATVLDSRERLLRGLGGQDALDRANAKDGLIPALQAFADGKPTEEVVKGGHLNYRDAEQARFAAEFSGQKFDRFAPARPVLSEAEIRASRWGTENQDSFYAFANEMDKAKTKLDPARAKGIDEMLDSALEAATKPLELQGHLDRWLTANLTTDQRLLDSYKVPGQEGLNAMQEIRAAFATAMTDGNWVQGLKKMAGAAEPLLDMESIGKTTAELARLSTKLV